MDIFQSWNYPSLCILGITTVLPDSTTGPYSELGVTNLLFDVQYLRDCINTDVFWLRWYNIMQSAESHRTFRKNILPPTWEWKNMPCKWPAWSREQAGFLRLWRMILDVSEKSFGFNGLSGFKQRWAALEYHIITSDCIWYPKLTYQPCTSSYCITRTFRISWIFHGFGKFSRLSVYIISRRIEINSKQGAD